MTLSKIKFDKKIVLSFWIILIALIVAAPSLLPVFRLNLLGRYLSLSIVALGVDLIWGYTGLLSLGQGIFFALGGYCLLYTSPSPRDLSTSRMPSSA